MSDYLMLKFGYSRSLAAMNSGSFYVARAISALIIGRIAMHTGRRKIFVILGNCLWLGSVFVIYCPTSVHMYVIIGANIISGIGSSSSVAIWPLLREYNGKFDCKDVATGVINTNLMFGGFVAQFVIAELIDFQWASRGGNDFNSDGDREYSMGDYNFGFVVIPIAVAIGFVCAICLKENKTVKVCNADDTQSK